MIKKIIYLNIFILLLYTNSITNYIPDPAIFGHGRGMYKGANWDIIDNIDGNGKVLDYINSFGVPIYLIDDFSGLGFGSLENWGDELKNWVDQFINDYKYRYGEFYKFKYVGYSAGGLAGRWFIANYGQDYYRYIERFITLHTPNQGSYLPYISEIVNCGAPGFLILGSIYTAQIITNPLLTPILTPGIIACTTMAFVAETLRIVFAYSSIKMLPPFGVSNRMDVDLLPDSNFFQKLENKEYLNQFKQQIKYKIVYGNRFFWNMTALEAVEWLAFLGLEATGQWLYAFIPLVALSTGFLQEGDMASWDKSQTGESGCRYGPWYISVDDNANKEFIRTNVNHLEITGKGKIILECLEDSPVISIENSNTFTAVKMEPDGCYVNIQKPEIHIDGSCDDYLIQWMGDNDRIRLRYDKYANVDEVVHLKNTEEGVFDYQRVGDVGRGWFSQNKIKQKEFEVR